MRNLSFAGAVNEALVQAMELDSSVFVYGIGVPDHKKVFGTTSGLLERFGPGRCFDTPLCEDAMTGFGIGAAMCGMRPVHVHIRVDFLLLAMNQLVNIASSVAYSTNGRGRVPFVIRAIVGRGWGQGYQHSKSLHSYFAHVPGLQVVLPTTPYDAKGLLLTALRGDDPVVFIEHRWLHWAEGDVPEEPYTVPFGRAHVLRPGRDVSVVATSWMNVEALQAADILSSRGIEVEVIDVRTLAPLDQETIVSSVRRTGRCIVADNDWIAHGSGAEIAAVVAERCFGELAAPVSRIGFAHAPCPTVRALERAFYPNAGTIVRSVETLLRLDPMPLDDQHFYSHEHRFRGPF